jgi:hypothetical protein
VIKRCGTWGMWIGYQRVEKELEWKINKYTKKRECRKEEGNEVKGVGEIKEKELMWCERAYIYIIINSCCVEREKR